MANPEHLKILKQGVEVWNKWRDDNPGIKPDLSHADLNGKNLSNANFSKADFIEADLSCAILKETDFTKADLGNAKLKNANLYSANLSDACLEDAILDEADLERTILTSANLWRASLRKARLVKADINRAYAHGVNLRGANLQEADLVNAVLSRADLQKSILIDADLREANCSGANLEDANLRDANLERSQFASAKLNKTDLTNCRVFGISAWEIELEGANQTNLIISRLGEPLITVDNLEVAQFVYLLLNNENIRNVIDTIGKKGVLILGRFTGERKVVLDAIRAKLRELGFVPMMFDFEKPTQRDFTETIKTLAGLSRFIIADITNPKSSPLELQAIMPDYMIPFVPIIQEDEKPFAMFQDLQQKYGEWVLDVLRYDSADNLLKVLDEAVVKPAVKMADELLIKKAEGIRDRHVKDYI